MCLLTRCGSARGTYGQALARLLFLDLAYKVSIASKRESRADQEQVALFAFLSINFIPLSRVQRTLHHAQPLSVFLYLVCSFWHIPLLKVFFRRVLACDLFTACLYISSFVISLRLSLSLPFVVLALPFTCFFQLSVTLLYVSSTRCSTSFTTAVASFEFPRFPFRSTTIGKLTRSKGSRDRQRKREYTCLPVQKQNVQRMLR